MSRVDILIPNPLTPLTVYRTVPQVIYVSEYCPSEQFTEKLLLPEGLYRLIPLKCRKVHSFDTLVLLLSRDGLVTITNGEPTYRSHLDSTTHDFYVTQCFRVNRFKTLVLMISTLLPHLLTKSVTC